MISIQSLRKQEQQEQAEAEARRQRELAAQNAAYQAQDVQVQGFNFGEPQAPQLKQGVLKFARFLYSS